MTGKVNRILPFSSVDGPGNRTAIFLQGCNFDCKYCHNPETITVCQNCGVCVEYCVPKALTFKNGKVEYDHTKCCFCDECFKHCPHGGSARVRDMSAEDVMREVRKNMPFIRGITVSGGECTLQRDFLLELFTLAKAEGLHTLIDSNGSYDFSADDELMAVADGVMLDVKAWSKEDHIRVTGVDNDMVKKNLYWLLENHKLTEVRTVIVPELFDVYETVREVSKATAPHQKGGQPRYKIIRYRPMGVREKYAGLASPTDELINELMGLAKAEGIKDVATTL